jgi:hypothetical protein
MLEHVKHVGSVERVYENGKTGQGEIKSNSKVV